MTNKKRYATEWFDQGDFTGEHDEIFEWLLMHWKEAVLAPDGFPIINGKIGSVMRQLNLYRERACASDVVLITRDHRFDASFEDQGYRVVDHER